MAQAEMLERERKATERRIKSAGTEVLGSERLTGALLDRLKQHGHILEINGESYRPKTSQQKRAAERLK